MLLFFLSGCYITRFGYFNSLTPCKNVIINKNFFRALSSILVTFWWQAEHFREKNGGFFGTL